MIKDVGLYDVVFIFWKLTNLNFETPQCFMLDLICTISFLVVGNMGYFSSPKILFQKSKKERDYLDRDVWEFLTNPRKFQELQQTFEKLEDSESSFWGQRGQLRCDGLLMWQRCNTLKKKTGLKAIIMFDKLLKMMEIFTRSHFPSFLLGCWFDVTSYFVTHLLPTKYNRLDMYGMVPIGGKPHLRKNCFPIFFPK